MTLIDGAALFSELGEFFPSRCTIQEPGTGSTDTYGEKAYPWPSLAGHTDIPCRVAPINSLRAAEVRRPDMTVTTQTHDVALAGHYPAVTSAMRAVVDAVTYNILGVKEDGNGTMTVLQVERVTV